MRLHSLLAWLQRRAEDLSVAMLLAMFVVFLIQIVSRYLLDLPMGWTHEVSVLLWLWLVLFGASFVLRDVEEMRFDLFYAAARPRVRRVMALLAAVTTIALFAWSMPATWDYVTFMKVQRTAYLGIRFDWLYGIYIVFAVMVIVRQLWIGWAAVFGPGPAANDPTQTSSGI